MNNKDKLQIIEEYNGLINKYTNMYYRSLNSNWISKDDLKQEIILGLLNDLDKLDESKGKSVFIEKSIENNCLSYITTRNRMKRGNGLADDSLDKKIINDDENINLIDVIGSDYDLEYDVINNIMVKDIFDYIKNNIKVRDTEFEKMYKVANREQLIFELYGKGYTFQEIGDKLVISKQRANYIFTRIINKIRDEFRIEVV